MSTSAVNRREALRRLALGGAGLASLPSWVESLNALAFEHAHEQRKPARAPAAAWKPQVFTPHQNATVIVLTELIIPQTDTPGAKAARVNEFIDGVLSKAKPGEREKFLSGLAWMDARSKQDHGAPFIKATADQQVALLTPLSAAADARNAAAQAASRPRQKAVPTSPPPDPTAPAGQADAAKQAGEKTPTEGEPLGADFFTALKSMTIVGYYTSEVGVREELGDDGMLFFQEFKGCTHPEHQKA